MSTLRGCSDGFPLALPREEGGIGAFVRLFEAPIPFAKCFELAIHTCPLSISCRLKRYIERVLDAFYYEFDKVTLRDLVQENCGLSALVTLRP